MNYREFWLEVKDGAIYEEPVDGLNHDAIHVIDYRAYERLQSKINSLVTVLSEMSRVQFDNGDSIHELERRALIAQQVLKELAYVK